MTWHSLFCRNLAKLPNSIFWTRNDHIGRRVICGCREIRKSVAIICSGCSPCHSLSVHCGKLFQSCCQSLNMNIDLFIGKRFSSESMGGNSSSSQPFCLTPLWDIDLTWNTDNPDFTRYFRPLFIQRLELENIFHKGVSTKDFPPRCFHQTVLTYIPTATLLFSLPFQIYLSNSSRFFTFEWGQLNLIWFSGICPCHGPCSTSPSLCSAWLSSCCPSQTCSTWCTFTRVEGLLLRWKTWSHPRKSIWTSGAHCGKHNPGSHLPARPPRDAELQEEGRGHLRNPLHLLARSNGLWGSHI